MSEDLTLEEHIKNGWIIIDILDHHNYFENILKKLEIKKYNKNVNLLKKDINFHNLWKNLKFNEHDYDSLVYMSMSISKGEMIIKYKEFNEFYFDFWKSLEDK